MHARVESSGERLFVYTIPTQLTRVAQPRRQTNFGECRSSVTDVVRIPEKILIAANQYPRLSAQVALGLGSSNLTSVLRTLFQACLTCLERIDGTIKILLSYFISVWVEFVLIFGDHG